MLPMILHIYKTSLDGAPKVPPPDTYIVLQQDKHAALSQLFGRVELVPGLLHLLHWYLPTAPPFVV